jgi:hypothetical protein
MTETDKNWGCKKQKYEYLLRQEIKIGTRTIRLNLVMSEIIRICEETSKSPTEYM